MAHLLVANGAAKVEGYCNMLLGGAILGCTTDRIQAIKLSQSRYWLSFLRLYKCDDPIENSKQNSLCLISCRISLSRPTSGGDRMSQNFQTSRILTRSDWLIPAKSVRARAHGVEGEKPLGSPSSPFS